MAVLSPSDDYSQLPSKVGDFLSCVLIARLQESEAYS